MYEKFDVVDGRVVLRDHTLRKFAVAEAVCAEALAKHPASLTACDMGCAEGAIAAALVDTFGDRIVVHAVNITAEELEVACVLAKTRPHMRVQPCRIQNVTDKFDVTCWFAILHHLLRSGMGKATLLQFVAQKTTQCAVVEVPIGADCLLGQVKATCPEQASDMAVLDSVESVLEWLRSSDTDPENCFASVQYVGPVPYDNSPVLHRHAFVCWK
jgi:hypothetical protein